MIKINLCPIDELESQFWYVPDVAAVFLVALLSLLGSHYFLSSLQDEVDDANTKKASLEENTAKLKQGGGLDRYKTLEDDITKLNAKLQALQLITVSKVARYKPVIVLEHLQNLKPDGVWYQSLRIITGASSAISQSGGNSLMGTPMGGSPGSASGGTAYFEITGHALDNILTSELMTNIRATESQDLDNADLRTQVYFNNLSLEKAIAGASGTAGPGVAPEFAASPEFSIRGDFVERTVAATPGLPDGRAPSASKPPAAAEKAPISASGPSQKKRHFFNF